MATEMMNQILNALVHGTLICVCTGFCLLGLLGVWKWFFGVVQRVLFALFPALRAWSENRQNRRNGRR